MAISKEASMIMRTVATLREANSLDTVSVSNESNS